MRYQSGLEQGGQPPPWLASIIADTTPTATPTKTSTPTPTFTVTQTPTPTYQMPAGTSAQVNSGTVTVQYGQENMSAWVNATVYKLNWESASTGGAGITLSGIYGFLDRIVWYPGTGTDAPSSNYDCTITDSDGYRVDTTYGTNLSSTTTTCYILSPALMLAGDLIVAVTQAGDGNKGTTKLYVEQFK